MSPRFERLAARRDGFIRFPRLTLGLAAMLFVLAPLQTSRAEPVDRAKAMIQTSVALSDPLWDDRSAFIWGVPSREHPSAQKLSVRGTAWYAFGLLARDGEGDRARAARAIEAVLRQQIDAPDEPWDGTFYRSPDEPNPPLFARVWDDYDPNWRQFIGTTWALILLRFPDRIPAALVPRLEDSMRRALEGELAQTRLKPEYTNIALMQAFLQSYLGGRLERPEWVKGGEEWARRIHELYLKHGTFEEYNAPTYYGVDLYGLALWREFGPTKAFREWGAEMEAGLWREIAKYYHAGLHNLCGPYDRTYGMDMQRYVSLTGVWMALVLDGPEAPLPAPGPEMEHGHDFQFAPLFAVLGARVPDDAMRDFTAFRGERTIERTIARRRTATAWLGQDIMIGGELTALSRSAGGPYSQFCPATVHWKTPSGKTGWVALAKCPRVDARASANRLEIQAIGDSIFRLSAPELDASQLTRDAWRLPGLNVQVETDARDFNVRPGKYWVEVEYGNATHLVLKTEKIP